MLIYNLIFHSAVCSEKYLVKNNLALMLSKRYISTPGLRKLEDVFDGSVEGTRYQLGKNKKLQGILPPL